MESPEEKEAYRQARRVEAEQFLADMKQFVGEKIAEFQFSDWDDGKLALIVKFETGKTMRFELDVCDCEGGFCNATASVNGTDLRFEPQPENVYGG